MPPRVVWRCEALAEECKVDIVLPFLRGYGPYSNSYDECVQTYYIDLVCDDIAAIVRKHKEDRGVDKVVVVGHDWGGIVAQ